VRLNKVPTITFTLLVVFPLSYTVKAEHEKIKLNPSEKNLFKPKI